MTFPQEKRTEISTAFVITVFEEPSKNLRLIGGMAYVQRLSWIIDRGSMKQCVEPQSTRTKKMDVGNLLIVTEIMRESELLRAEALRVTKGIARIESLQFSNHAISEKLLTIFSIPEWNSTIPERVLA